MATGTGNGGHGGNGGAGNGGNGRDGNFNGNNGFFSQPNNTNNYPIIANVIPQCQNIYSNQTTIDGINASIKACNDNGNCNAATVQTYNQQLTAAMQAGTIVGSTCNNQTVLNGSLGFPFNGNGFVSAL